MSQERSMDQASSMDQKQPINQNQEQPINPEQPMEPSPRNQIKLDQFLKFVGIAQTGGQAKMLIQAGEVRVNGKLEIQRGRKLAAGDRVTTMGETFTVEARLSKSGDR
jgi:ribosome-associated protein